MLSLSRVSKCSGSQKAATMSGSQPRLDQEVAIHATVRVLAQPAPSQTVAREREKLPLWLLQERVPFRLRTYTPTYEPNSACPLSLSNSQNCEGRSNGTIDHSWSNSYSRTLQFTYQWPPDLCLLSHPSTSRLFCLHKQHVTERPVSNQFESTAHHVTLSLVT